MADNYYLIHKDRAPIADSALLIAVAATVISLIKLLMYGFTYVPLIWLIITIMFISLFSATKGNSKLAKAASVVYIIISAIAIYAGFAYDQPLKPKRESNIKTEQEYINKEDQKEEVIIDTPKPVQVETTNIVQEDASTFEEVPVNDTGPAYYDPEKNEEEDGVIDEQNEQNNNEAFDNNNDDIDNDNQQQPTLIDEEFQ